jgi:hypothetical protein
MMCISQRTYPEICPAAIKLSTKYNKPIEADTEEAVAEYVYAIKDTQKLITSPSNLIDVSAAYASHADHQDSKSHGEGVVGFD